MLPNGSYWYCLLSIARMRLMPNIVAIVGSNLGTNTDLVTWRETNKHRSALNQPYVRELIADINKYRPQNLKVSLTIPTVSIELYAIDDRLQPTISFNESDDYHSPSIS
ncbi:uncharacterized protein FPRO_02600 [Fusarium proliferatum ET1]|uniref:Uncharacterized protein n=1 Tax=Fusarium proliferatum (strain ET1) TaxID=1227346 RepID=A0A1L7VCM1_FUSPR|nr:uncharacterized protein FPRO_02600 [Fusarium proliferatum ET1]CZR37140.1 uncharacterized protein FPRO_02600 [Fusarium proliferatum ET1]